MDKSEAEIKFEEYRKYLQQEATRLVSYILLYRRLHNLRNERLAEMNIAPAFFRVVIDALYSVIILWGEKMLSDKSERGMFNFLTFCEYNRKIFEIKELQRRRNYPDGHWMLLDRPPVTFETIQEDKRRIIGLESLPSLKLLRDKYHAHFDKEYFFDRSKLSEDASLKWSDLDEVITIIKDIINSYSADYDGQLFSLAPVNVTDIDYLLNRLHMSMKEGSK